MKKNTAKADRIIRVFVVAIILVLFAVKLVGGPIGVALLLLCGVLLFGSVTGYCPLYHYLDMDTTQLGKEKKQ